MKKSIILIGHKEILMVKQQAKIMNDDVRLG